MNSRTAHTTQSERAHPGGSPRPVDRLGPPFVLLLGVAVALRPGLEHDVWWHMASGQWMVAERAWLREDVFSWPQLGQPWVRPGLMADIGMYAIHSVAGAPGLKVATAALFVATFALLWRCSSGSGTWRTTVLVLCVLTAVVATVARPLILSLPLAAVTAVVLDRERQVATRWLWLLPVVSLLWVNLHGAYVVSFVLLGCHVAARLIDAARTSGAARAAALRAAGRLGAVALLTVAATLVNPFGWRMLPYPFETLGLTVLGDFVHEWRQPTLSDPQFWPLFVLVAVTIVTLVRGRSCVRTDDLMVALAFGGLAMTAARHAAIFAVVIPPVLTRVAPPSSVYGLRKAWRGASAYERRVEVVLLGAVAVAVAGLVSPALTVDANDRATRELIAVDAADRVAEGDLPDRLWNSYDQGGYLIWAAWPDVLVSMDSRTDLHGDRAVRRHVEVWSGVEGAADELADLGVSTVLVERSAPLVGVLEEAGWRPVFEDDLAVVLTVSG